jgi:alpha-galactosidase
VHTIRRDQYRLETTAIGTEPVVIHGGRWNRPEHAGWLVLEDVQARECLLIGIEWERDWELALTPVDDGLEVAFRLLDYRTDMKAGEVLDSPALFVALSHGDLDDVSNHARHFLSSHVFPKKLPDFPWVSYDIWSTDGEGVEEALCREMDFSADLGVDLFYVDASWWAGSSVIGTGAWGLGLGGYEEDRRKFPSGLRSLSDRAHRQGMRFGLWVDPMIIDASHVERGLVPAHWLIQENGVDSELRIGVPDWPPVKQLCTGSVEVQDYLIEKLSSIVERFALDWLKWDDSALALPCCTRTDHGHGAQDGNLEALKGKYRICAALLERFPDLVIEQCGYPARLDYGLASYVRSNWLSDASTPSVHVRNNMEIACYIYPASYNAAWILRDDETRQENDRMTVDSIVRSRMMGLFGLGTLTGQLSERISLLPQSLLDGIKRNVLHYKKFRNLLSQNTWHLSSYVREPDDWQAMEFSAWDGGQAVALLFRGDSGLGSYTLKPRGLDPVATYTVECFDARVERTESGRSLMEVGIPVYLERKEASEIVLITKK